MNFLYLHVMWSHTVVCGPVADNVVSVAKIVGLTPLLFASNLVSILACLWSERISFVVRYTYALQKQTNDPRELATLLMKLCEKTGRRLRRARYSAQGVHVACVYTDLSHWHTGRKFDVPVYTTRDIYVKALRLLNSSGYPKRVRNLAVSVYDLIPSASEQLELFASPSHAVSDAMDKINDRWGEFVITPALMMGMEDIILDRIAFGGVKELEEIYSK
jgi:impB/mucB/samB family C-terminal domain